MTHKKQLNWTNILFFTCLPLLSLIGTVLLCVFSTITWPTWVLTGALFVACGLTITAGYHRLFSHRSYQAKWPLQLLFVLIGSASFEGSILEWATDHRNHHRFTDTPKDPYNIKQGFWYAHLGWLFTIGQQRRDFSNVSDLLENKLLCFQHRYFTAISIIMGFGLPTLIASLWGEPLAGLIIAGGLRMTLTHHSTFCINSLCHILGKRNYSHTTSARDNWLSSIITFGEGNHNYHHQFPLDYRNGDDFYAFDPGKWLIFGLRFLGLTSKLRRIPQYRIIQARVESHKMKTKSTWHIIDQLQHSILLACTTVKNFEKQYIGSTLKEHTHHLQNMKQELLMLFQAWKVLHKKAIC